MTDEVRFPTPAQLVDRVPLIKNPGFWIPKPIQVPLDIHPLPDDVQAYFVYPHTLESHVLSTLPAALAQLETARQQRLALLASYAESKERARKAELNRLAPGYREGTGVMQPLRATGAAAVTTRLEAQAGDDLLLPQDGRTADPVDDPNRSTAAAAASDSSTTATSAVPDIFKDFVDGLEKLDSTLGGGASANRTADVDNLI